MTTIIMNDKDNDNNDNDINNDKLKKKNKYNEKHKSKDKDKKKKQKKNKDNKQKDDKNTELNDVDNDDHDIDDNDIDDNNINNSNPNESNKHKDLSSSSSYHKDKKIRTSENSSFEYVINESNENCVAPPIYIRSKKSNDIRMENGLLTDAINYPSDYLLKTFPLNNPEESHWSIIKTFNCMYDCHSFTGYVLSIPLKYDSDKKTYEVYGQFCSPACMRSYLNENRNFNVAEISVLLQQMMLDIYDYFYPISIAPCKESLEMFGGWVTIEKFREIVQLRKPIDIRMVTPPFYVAPCYLISKPIKGHIDHEEMLKLDSVFTKCTTTPRFTRFLPHEHDPALKSLIKMKMDINNKDNDKEKDKDIDNNDPKNLMDTNLNSIYFDSIPIPT